LPEVDHHNAARQYLAKFISTLEEHWTLAAELASLEPFVRVGLADTAITQLANRRTDVLTTDFQLGNLLLERGVKAVNFNWLRSDS
jgi:hypothetical protein